MATIGSMASNRIEGRKNSKQMLTNQKKKKKQLMYIVYFLWFGTHNSNLGGSRDSEYLNVLSHEG